MLLSPPGLGSVRLIIICVYGNTMKWKKNKQLIWKNVQFIGSMVCCSFLLTLPPSLWMQLSAVEFHLSNVVLLYCLLLTLNYLLSPFCLLQSGCVFHENPHQWHTSVWQDWLHCHSDFHYHSRYPVVELTHHFPFFTFFWNSHYDNYSSTWFCWSDFVCGTELKLGQVYPCCQDPINVYWD